MARTNDFALGKLKQTWHGHSKLAKCQVGYLDARWRWIMAMKMKKQEGFHFDQTTTITCLPSRTIESRL